jgi:hypothetical protein
MARRSKKSSLERAMVDLREWEGAPLEAIKARAVEAVGAAIDTFDVKSRDRFVFWGKDGAPMGSQIIATDKGVRIRVAVSARAVSLEKLSISPSLSSNTTGSRRTEVTVRAEHSRSVTVPNGFIWGGTIWRRTSGYHTGIRRKKASNGRYYDSYSDYLSNITRARQWLIEAFADPSPAYLLGAAKDDVIAAMQSTLLEAIDGGIQGKNSK